jgi:hypothetical protein
MKKTFLILTLVLISLFGYGNNIKIQNFYSHEKIDSIKTTLSRDGIFLKLNIPSFEDKLYLYDTFVKYKYYNCTKYETIIFDFESNEQIGLNILFFTDGTKFITLKNLRTGGMAKYNINS